MHKVACLSPVLCLRFQIKVVEGTSKLTSITIFFGNEIRLVAKFTKCVSPKALNQLNFHASAETSRVKSFPSTHKINIMRGFLFHRVTSQPSKLKPVRIKISIFFKKYHLLFCWVLIYNLREIHVCFGFTTLSFCATKNVSVGGNLKGLQAMCTNYSFSYLRSAANLIDEYYHLLLK